MQTLFEELIQHACLDVNCVMNPPPQLSYESHTVPGHQRHWCCAVKDHMLPEPLSPVMPYTLPCHACHALQIHGILGISQKGM